MVLYRAVLSLPYNVTLVNQRRFVDPLDAEQYIKSSLVYGFVVLPDDQVSPDAIEVPMKTEDVLAYQEAQETLHPGSVVLLDGHPQRWKVYRVEKDTLIVRAEDAPEDSLGITVFKTRITVVG